VELARKDEEGLILQPQAVASVMGRGGRIRLHAEEDIDAAPSEVFRPALLARPAEHA
jgi:hypothetical protein